MFRPQILGLTRVVLLVICAISTSLATAYGSNDSDSLVPHDLSIIFSNNTTADYKACG
jgi:hypothetical protein